MAAEANRREALDAAQDDLTAFSEMIGRPLTAWQAAALSLETRHTALLAPRQTGKSTSLAILTAWWLFRRPAQEVLVLSAREDTAKNLLKTVRSVAAHPLLRLSVTEDLKTRLELSNGSAVEAVPSSEAAIRGRSIDLLLIDEAAFVDDELIQSAALPTTMARPDARVVLASTPWGAGGTFYSWWQAGIDGTDPDVRAFTWRVADAPWVVPSVVEAMRRRLPAARFRAEVLGEWVAGGDSFLPGEDIDAAVASYPMVRDGGGAPAVLGADWGRDRDAHGLVLAGLLADGGVNGRPVVVVPYCETSRRRYEEQVGEIEKLAGAWDLTVMSERKGVGMAPTEQLTARLIRSRVIPVRTTQELKEAAYSRLQLLLSARQIVLPDHPQLIAQLKGIVAKPTPLGGLRIEARTESLHDDLADALAFAVLGLPEPARLAEAPPRDWPEGAQWAATAGGLRVPLPVATVRADESYAGMYGGYVICGKCQMPYPSYRERCATAGCSEPNPEHKTRPASAGGAAGGTPGATAAGDGEAVPAGNQWNPHLMRCPAEHLFDGRIHTTGCPQCRGGAARSRFARPGPFGGFRGAA